MRFGAAFWIQRTTWPELRDACLAAERAGWDSLWVDDHLLADEGDPSDPKLEGWATISALATVTRRVRLGLLVGANTFRGPGLTAKLATTVDHLSGGRFVLGLGGGWFEPEHDAFGLDFGSGFGERLDRLDESVGLIRRLLDGERVTHEGRLLRDARRRLRAAADPGTPADPHRWLRAYQDAADDGPRCRPVERLRRTRADRAGQRHPARSLRRDRPPLRRDRTHRHRPRRDPRHGTGRDRRLDRDRAPPWHRRPGRRRRHRARPHDRWLTDRRRALPRRLSRGRHQRGDRRLSGAVRRRDHRAGRRSSARRWPPSADRARPVRCPY